MKLNVTESIFTNGNPYIEIVEGITKDDITYEVSKTKYDPQKAINSNSEWDRDLRVSIWIKPTDELKELLGEYMYDDGPHKQPLWKSPFHMGNEVTGYKYGKDFYSTVKFRGMKTEKSKIDKYNEVYNDSIENFNIEENLKSVLVIINRLLQRSVDGFNKRGYERDVPGFYENVSTYVDQWNPILEKNKELTKLNEDIEDIEGKLKSLKEELRTKKSKKGEIINATVLKELKGHDIQKDIKSELIDKLSDPNCKLNDGGASSNEFDLLH